MLSPDTVKGLLDQIVSVDTSVWHLRAPHTVLNDGSRIIVQTDYWGDQTEALAGGLLGPCWQTTNAGSWEGKLNGAEKQNYVVTKLPQGAHFYMLHHPAGSDTTYWPVLPAATLTAIQAPISAFYNQMGSFIGNAFARRIWTLAPCLFVWDADTSTLIVPEYDWAPAPGDVSQTDTIDNLAWLWAGDSRTPRILPTATTPKATAVTALKTSFDSGAPSGTARTATNFTALRTAFFAALDAA